MFSALVFLTQDTIFFFKSRITQTSGPRQKFRICSCRKCMCSRDQLCAAETYSDIHADTFENRNDQTMHEDFLASQTEGVKHVNGIWQDSLFFQFPKPTHVLKVE